uniref:Ig-like domain-containing protein n=1 Tax=Lates calcarifer TaxID=8187 RepID=A0A4W6EFK0_LATCA
MCLSFVFILLVVLFCVFLMSTVSNSITVTLQPNWPLIYRGETITVRCEIQGGGDTEWMYEWTLAKLNTPPSHNEYRINRATESDSGDYRCKARSEYLLTEWSDKVRLTVSRKLKHLSFKSVTSSSETNCAGGSVTLTCSVIRSAGWTVFKWYRRSSDSSEAQVINGIRSDHIIRISEGGIYTCRGGRGKPETLIHLHVVHRFKTRVEDATYCSVLFKTSRRACLLVTVILNLLSSLSPTCFNQAALSCVSLDLKMFEGF